MYLLLDTIEALERCGEAREEDSSREISHSDYVKPHKNQITHRRGGSRSARGSTQGGPCEAGLGSEGGETSLPLPSTPLDEPRRRLNGRELQDLTERIASMIDSGDEEAQQLLDLWRREMQAKIDGEVSS